ncbi:DC-STAMP domain-containing protein 2-like [Musca vetustissima]|uniref:DC-STAMP domain-containing protein 2-like n=1 Tax=Musca vetustissima TaxID=27455 RepID=UPI002AB7AC84|nr:DC-STAMP domain-containing protein 2-like [Musca vetustissima]
MSFLEALQAKRNKLKNCETIVTTATGERFKENTTTQEKEKLDDKSASMSYGFVVDTKPDFIPAYLPESSLTNGVLDKAFNFIDKALNNGGCVLIHCNAGVSRSASVVIAYLMKYKNMDFEIAHGYVKTRRECIQPNAGFLKQLRSLNSTYPVNTARWLALIILGFVVIFLSYSKDIRCIASLSIPILCSSKGRSLIIALAFFMAATGPTLNLFRNIDVMVSSLSCGQMQLKQALGEMLDTLKKPLVAIKDAIHNAVNDLRNVLKKVQHVLLTIQALIVMILATMKNAFAWLRNIVRMCNKEFGTPYERCMKIAHDAIRDCEMKLGAVKSLCQVTQLFAMLCYATKVVDVICVLVVFVNESIIETVMERLKMFTDEVKRLFDVSITFDHDFYFKTTTSRELDDIKKDIMFDIHSRMKTFVLIFGWLDMLSLFMFALIVFKAIYFRLKYLHNFSYQNYYITKDFVEIDENRKNLHMETALPLSFMEKMKYPWLTDCRLTHQEWLAISRSGVFLAISSIQLFCICFADYSLFWLLAMISYYGHKEKGFTIPPYITVEIEGGGFVGEIFGGIVHAFEPISQNYTMDPHNCLPLPHRPNYGQYYLIGMLLAFAWMFLFCQPYGLRLRHIVMRLYYPDVARQRAIWLYNRILLKRISFFKLARRKARMTFTKNKTGDNFSLLDWLRVKTEGYWLFRLILGHRKADKCLLCGTPLNDSLVKCETIACKAVYCKKCFQESNNICCICHNPVDYGDFSDLSEVEDSSDDPNVIHFDETDGECLIKKWNEYID